jgi:hypothetical protein
MLRLLRDFQVRPFSGPVRKFALCERGALTVELVALMLILAVGALAVTGMIFKGLATPACGVVTQLDPNADCGG